MRCFDTHTAFKDLKAGTPNQTSRARAQTCSTQLKSIFAQIVAFLRKETAHNGHSIPHQMRTSGSQFKFQSLVCSEKYRAFRNLTSQQAPAWTKKHERTAFEWCVLCCTESLLSNQINRWEKYIFRVKYQLKRRNQSNRSLEHRTRQATCFWSASKDAARAHANTQTETNKDELTQT